MKTNNIISLLCFLFGMLALSSCGYEEYADADYPAATVYQSMAVNGVYNIDSSCEHINTTVTSGNIDPYTIDKSSGKLNINLGVTLSGIKRQSVNVTLAKDASSVSQALDDGILDTATTSSLQDDAFTLPTTVKTDSRLSSAPYAVQVDLNTIIAAKEGNKLAFAVKIVSSDVNVSDQYSTLVVVIDCDFIKSKL